MAGRNDINFTVGFRTDDSSLKQLKKSLYEIQTMTRSQLMEIRPDMDDKKVMETLFRIKREATQVEQALKLAFNPKLGTYNIDKFTNAMGGTKKSLNDIQRSWSEMGAKGKNAFLDLEHSMLKSNKSLEKTQTIVDKIGITLANTLKWNIASSAINQVTRSVSEAYGYVKNLDTSLNNIQIVTQKSADEMERFADRANDAAKALGVSTTSYTNAALTFYQQGLSDTEVQARTNLTEKVSNASGLSAEESAEYVTSVLNGYKVGSEEAEQAMDVLANVGAHTASSLSELSQAMAKVSSTASTMGVSEEQLAATLATVIETTRQDPKSVGTAFKTIYMRISDIKAGTEDAEVSLGNYTAQMAQLGINVLDSSGELRDLGEVMEEVGSGWSDMSREQQISLARTMAGTRQANNLLALFDNWETYGKALGYAEDSMGTLQQQQDTYMESTRAHLQELKTRTEDLYDSLLDSDSINVVADILSVIVDKITEFVDAIGGGTSVLLAFGAIASRVFTQQIAVGLTGVYNKIKQPSKKLAARKEQYKNANAYKQDVNNVAVNEMANKYEEMWKIESKLTEEQRKEYEAALETQFVLKKNKNLREEEVELAEKKLKQAEAELTDSEKTLQNYQVKLKNNQDKTLKSVASENNMDLQNFRDISKKYGGDPNLTVLNSNKKLKNVTDEDINKLRQFVQNKRKSTYDITNDKNSAKDKITAFSNQYKKISNSEDFKNANEKGKLEIIKQTLKAEREELDLLSKYTDLLEKTKNSLNENTQEIEKQIVDTEKLIKAQQDNVDTANQEVKETKQRVNEANADDEHSRKTAEEIEKEMQQHAKNVEKVESFINVLGGLSSTVMGLQSLKQIPEIISNEDLSVGEKFFELLSSGSMGLMMTVTGLSQMTTAISGLKTAYGTLNPLKMINNLLEEKGIFLNKTSAKVKRAEILATEGDAAATEFDAKAKVGLAAATKAAAASAKKLLISIAPMALIFAGITIAISAVYGELTKLSHAQSGLTEFNSKVSELNSTIKEHRAQVSNLKGSVEEYNALSEKAGANDVHLSSLSDQELERYNELKDAILDLDETQLAYYDNQGNAILKNNQDLEKTIDLIQEKQRLEEAETWKEASKGYEQNLKIVRDDAVKNKQKLLKEAESELTKSKVYKLATKKGLVDDSSFNLSDLSEITVKLQEGENSLNSADIAEFDENLANYTRSIEDATNQIESLSKYGTTYLKNQILYDDKKYQKLLMASNYDADSVEQATTIAAQYIDTRESVSTTNDYNSMLSGDAKSGGTSANAAVAYTEQQSKDLLDLAHSQGKSFVDYNNALIKELETSFKDLDSEEQLQRIVDMYHLDKLDDELVEQILESYTDANVDIEDGVVKEAGAKLNDDILNAIKRVGLSPGSVVNWGSDTANLKEIVKQSVEKTGATEINEDYFSNIFNSYIASLAKQNGENLNQSLSELLEKSGMQAGYLSNIAKATSITEFSKSFKELDLSNLGVLNSLTECDAQLVTIAGSFDNASTELAKYNEMSEGFIYIWSQDKIQEVVKNIELATRAGELANMDGIESSAEEIEIVAKALKHVDENAEASGVSLANSAAALERFREALDVEDDIKVINEEMTDGVDLADMEGKQLLTLADAYADVLNISKDAVVDNDNFMFGDDAEENVDALIKLMDSGSQEAADKLAKNFADGIKKGLSIDGNDFDFSSISNEWGYKLNDLGSMSGDFFTDFKAMTDAAVTENNSEVLDGLTTDLLAAGATTDEIESLFRLAGYDITIDQTNMTQSIQQLCLGALSTAANAVKLIITSFQNIASNISAFLENPLGALKGEVKFTNVFDKNALSDLNSAWGMISSGASGLADADGSNNATTTVNGTVDNVTESQRKKAIKAKNSKDAHSGSSSNNKSKKPQTTEVEKERDVYYEIDEALSKIEHDYKMLNTQRKHLQGSELAEAINKENKYLEKNASLLKDRIKISKDELAKTQSELASTFGASFDADGLFTNYDELFEKEYATLQEAAKAYDSAKNDDNEDNDDAAEQAWDAAQKRFEKFEDLADKQNTYLDKVYSDTEEYLDKQYEIISNAIEAVTAEIEVTLDLNKAKEEWIDFQSKYLIGEDQDSNVVKVQLAVDKINMLDDSGVIEQAKANFDLFKTAYEQAAAGDIQSLLANEATKAFVGTDASGNAIVDLPALRKAMTEAQSEYISAYSEREDLLDNITEYELAQIKEVYEATEEINKLYADRLSLVEHEIKMVKLLYGEDAYGKIADLQSQQGDLIQTQIDNLESQADTTRALQNEAYQNMMAHANDSNRDLYNKYKDEYELYSDELSSTTDELKSKLEELGSFLKETFENSVSKSLQTLNEGITGFSDTDKLEYSYSLETLNRDTYLDEIDKGYELKALQNKWVEAINDTDSITAQQKLNKLMDEQLAKLEAKGELTEKDIERANLEYELALKQIALEEAQQNKSKMRLKRDSQGNYSYQFVADEDSITQAQKELDEAQKKLYDFDKETLQSNQEEVLKLYAEMQKAIEDHAYMGEDILEQIYDSYMEKITDIAGENQYLVDNLINSGQDAMKQLFEDTVDDADIILNAGLSNIYQDLIDKIVDDPDSFKNKVANAVDDIGEKYDEWQNKLEDLGEQSERVSKNMASDLDNVDEYATDLLNTATEALDKLREISRDYSSTTNNITSGGAYDNSSSSSSSANSSTGSSTLSGSSSTASLSSNSVGNGTPNNGVIELGDNITLKAGAMYYENSKGGGRMGNKYSGVTDGVVVDRINSNTYGVHIKSADGKYTDLGWVKPEDLIGFDTGGYTGVWGSSGKLAMLHQKELVLNENDTKNLLNTVEVMRSIYDGYKQQLNGFNIDSITSIATAIGNGIKDFFNDLTLNQNVEITASFEGQTEADQITKAFENLVNIASQRAFSK